MEVKKLKRKKISEPANVSYFPRFPFGKCAAFYRGISCYVELSSDSINFVHMGFYGSGNLFRGEPSYEKLPELPECVLEQLHSNRLYFEASDNGPSHSEINHKRFQDVVCKSVLSFLQRARNKSNVSIKNDVRLSHSTGCFRNIGLDAFLNNSNENDNDDQDDILRELVNDIQTSEGFITPQCLTHGTVIVVGPNGPREERAPFRQREKLVLDLQEAFFLAAALRVLDVFDDGSGKVMSLSEMWSAFQKIDTRFVLKYVAYHWYRSKGWIVRPGLKQGGDFVLYEKGPPFCHSSYVVHVREGNARLQWNELAGFSRLVETFRKDVLVCCVLMSSSSDVTMNYEAVKNCRVIDILWRRWVPCQQRSQK